MRFFYLLVPWVFCIKYIHVFCMQCIYEVCTYTHSVCKYIQTLFQQSYNLWALSTTQYRAREATCTSCEISLAQDQTKDGLCRTAKVEKVAVSKEQLVNSSMRWRIWLRSQQEKVACILTSGNFVWLRGWRKSEGRKGKTSHVWGNWVKIQIWLWSETSGLGLDKNLEIVSGFRFQLAK